MAKAKKADIGKQQFSKSALQFLENYINNAAPTGHEYNGQKLWRDYLKPFTDSSYIDNYGSAIAVINTKAKYKVVIEAHADEIGWYVNYITDNGLIHVVRNGGSDHQIAPSKRVNIHTDNGVVKGVFGWPAIHTRKKDDEESPTVSKIFIDCGAVTKKEVAAMGIEVGNPITYEDAFTTLNNRYFVGRALDNRIGGFMIAEVARMLHENKKELPFGLYIVNAVQEEVGLYGASMVADSLAPDVAIVTDVTHDTSTPLIKKEKEGDTACGKGPVIAFAPAIQNNLNKLILKAAKEAKIEIQRAASSGSTGTDTDAFAYSNGGTPSALISLPLRYMHTTVEMVDMQDVQDTIKLIYHSLLAIKNNHNFKYDNPQ